MTIKTTIDVKEVREDIDISHLAASYMGVSTSFIFQKIYNYLIFYN